MIEDDDQLLAAVSAAVDLADPIPPEVTGMAKAIPSFRKLDAELAALAQPVLEGVGVRLAEPENLPLLFETEELAIVVEFAPEFAIDVVGIGVTSVEVQRASGETIAAPQRDGGMYSPERSVIGPARVLVISGELSIATDWFTVV